MKINLYSALKKSTIGLLLFYVGLVFSQITTPVAGTANCVCEESVNVWYKVSTDNLTYGDVIRLDMSRGQAFSDPMYIYILSKDIDTGEVIVVAFPNGGDWHVFSQEDSLYMEMEEDINDLQKYLKKRGSTEIKKKQ